MTTPRLLVAVGLVVVSLLTAVADEAKFPVEAKRILFLGDSITHAGHYVSLVEAQLRLTGQGEIPELINVGLPSETCSGLSEPEHPFPRPNVQERIDRALAKVKPDVVVACYGMNDGIYYPFSEDRFEAYRKGINEIIAKVHASGAKLVLMTPPAFDPLPLQEQGKLLPAGADKYSWKAIYENYDDVMKRYSEWIVQRADRVDMVIDLHTPVVVYVEHKRNSDPMFTMSPDGVHVNHEGHEVLAAAIMKAWGLGEPVEPDQGLLTLIEKRQQLIHAAWLSEVGHKRPGVKAGLPIKEAKAQAGEIEKQIRARVMRQQDAARPVSEGIHRLHFPASDKPGELSLLVDYDLWIPPGVKQLRGIIVHQHGCGVGASNAGLTAANDLHWQALAKRWDCALMGSSYEGRPGASCRLWCDPRNGSDQRFLEAIESFAKSTGHEEIRDIPWCIWGHSGGGFWASLMQAAHPDRIVGIWLQSGTAFLAWESGEIEAPVLTEKVFQVPVMACPGLKEKDHERFHRAWDGLQSMMKAYRSRGAPFGIAPDPRTGHECGDSRYLAIPFFDACLSQRLAEPGSNVHKLRPIDESLAWLGDSSGKVVSASSARSDPQQMSWLPDESFAKKWSEFVEKGSVSDVTPPAKPKSLRAIRKGDQVVLTWDADADFESGLGGFRIERGDKTIAKLPSKPVGRFGRPIFQTMTYSETPAQPVAKMRLVDEVVPSNGALKYRIYSINSVGLESDPAIVTIP